ncbi:MAG: DUF917 domain-containing protein [Pseudomonadota bacterium]
MHLARRHFMAGLALSSAGLLTSCASTGTATTPRRTTKSGRVLSEQSLQDALTGSSYLGTGGGGSLEEARVLIQQDLDAGRTFELINVADLSDTDRVACPYGLGSIAPDADAPPPAIALPVRNAFELLADYVGTPFSGIILGEIGPLSLAEGLSTAARLGVPALDADTVGRAVPEINQHSVRVAGESLTPAACVTQQGDEIILKSVLDDSRPETVFRALSTASGVVGVVDSPITGATAKREGVLVQNSFTLSESIGRAVREARATGTDPIDAARVAGDGYTLFHGMVGDYDWADADGFLEGWVTLQGRGPDQGQSLRLDFKNEHLVATKDGQVIATCPDLISLIDEETADGIGNPDFVKGQAVRVLGFRCDPLWRTEAGLEVFSPRYFGYDVDYVPIEERLV